MKQNGAHIAMVNQWFLKNRGIKMKKLLCVLCMALSLVACSEEKSDKPVVKIGVSLPLSGDMANIGTIMKGAVEVAEQDLHAKYKDLKYNYKFIIEDNALEIKRAALVNQKFFSVDNVDAIIDFSSVVGLTTSPLAEKNKVIHISANASDAKVAGGKYNFIHWTQPKYEVEKLAEKIVKDKFDNIVIFTGVDPAWIEMSQNLQDLLAKHKIKFTEFRTNNQERDFNLLLKKAATTKPELYVLFEYSPALDIILKRLQEAKNTVPVTSVEAFSFLDDKSVIEGFWYTDAAELKPEYIEKFTTHNKSENVFSVGNAYDAAMLVVYAFEHAENKETAVDELLKLKEYDGVVGRIIQDENGIFNSNAVLKRIINGKPVVVDK